MNDTNTSSEKIEQIEQIEHIWGQIKQQADARFLARPGELDDHFGGDVLMNPHARRHFVDDHRGDGRPDVTLPTDSFHGGVEAVASNFATLEGDEMTETVAVSMADGSVESVVMRLPPEGTSHPQQLPPEASQRMLAMLQGGTPETEALPSKQEREISLPGGEDPHIAGEAATGVRKQHRRTAILDTHMNKTWCQPLPDDDRRPLDDEGIDRKDLHTGRGTHGSGKGLPSTNRDGLSTKGYQSQGGVDVDSQDGLKLLVAQRVADGRGDRSLAGRGGSSTQSIAKPPPFSGGDPDRHKKEMASASRTGPAGGATVAQLPPAAEGGRRAAGRRGVAPSNRAGPAAAQTEDVATGPQPPRQGNDRRPVTTGASGISTRGNLVTSAPEGFHPPGVAPRRERGQAAVALGPLPVGAAERGGLHQGGRAPPREDDREGANRTRGNATGLLPVASFPGLATGVGRLAVGAQEPPRRSDTEGLPLSRASHDEGPVRPPLKAPLAFSGGSQRPPNFLNTSRYTPGATTGGMAAGRRADGKPPEMPRGTRGGQPGGVARPHALASAAAAHVQAPRGVADLQNESKARAAPPPRPNTSTQSAAPLAPLEYPAGLGDSRAGGGGLRRQEGMSPQHAAKPLKHVDHSTGLGDSRAGGGGLMRQDGAWPQHAAKPLKHADHSTGLGDSWAEIAARPSMAKPQEHHEVLRVGVREANKLHGGGEATSRLTTTSGSEGRIPWSSSGDRSRRELPFRHESSGVSRSAPEMVFDSNHASGIKTASREDVLSQPLPSRDASVHGGKGLHDSMGMTTRPLSVPESMNRDNREGEIEMQSFATIGNMLTTQEAAMQDIAAQFIEEEAGEEKENSLRGSMGYFTVTRAPRARDTTSHAHRFGIDNNQIFIQKIVRLRSFHQDRVYGQG